VVRDDAASEMRAYLIDPGDKTLRQFACVFAQPQLNYYYF
jgi:hypothetical protein